MEVERNSLYGIDYYKRNTFMGSLGIMNYRIYKAEEKVEAEEEAQQEDTKVYLEAVCWHGPYIFSKTEEEQKHYKRFSFDNEGLDKITEWLNEEYRIMEKEDN